ncbi:MAG: cytochrome c4 [Betaproteobacteria bacterium]|nr:cytochrome c4 [Betaproteobacteria bacterium]NCW81337.1 cytochrome c4 [Betaproteobacteria bacterium]
MPAFIKGNLKGKAVLNREANCRSQPGALASGLRAAANALRNAPRILRNAIVVTGTGLALVFGSSAAWAQDKAAAKVAKPDIAAGQQIAGGVCAGCHAADGNSPSPANPKLAAQHAAYLAKQLHNFKPQAEGKPPERNNAIMQGFASALNDQQIRDVSAYFAAQKLKPAAAKNKDLVELGQKIYRGGIADKGVPACAGCHSPNGAGIPDQYPRLQGQYAEYTESQLVAFRQGTRANSTQMMTIAARMSDKEMKAVSDYIAGLR